MEEKLADRDLPSLEALDEFPERIIERESPLFDERRVLVKEHDRDAGHVGGFAHPVGERLQVSHARRVQRPGRSASVRFADVASGTQAVVREPDL